MPEYRHTITYTNGYTFDETSSNVTAQAAEQAMWDYLTGFLFISRDKIQDIKTVEIKQEA